MTCKVSVYRSGATQRWRARIGLDRLSCTWNRVQVLELYEWAGIDGEKAEKPELYCKIWKTMEK